MSLSNIIKIWTEKPIVFEAAYSLQTHSRFSIHFVGPYSLYWITASEASFVPAVYPQSQSKIYSKLPFAR